MNQARPWSRAWAHASRTFWSHADPGSHFRTSVGPEVADRIAAVVCETDARLGGTARRVGTAAPVGLERFTVVDIGCGDGALLAMVKQRCRHLGDRIRWVGIDMRPVSVPGIDSIVACAPVPLGEEPFLGVVMAHEWLDEIPCDVVERDEMGVDRLVLVHDDGSEVLGPALADDAGCAAIDVDAASMREWIARWWPLHQPGDRAEVGLDRDRAWAWMAGLLTRGTVLATDYGHEGVARSRWRNGTLTAYREGRVTAPVPDGTVGLTAHVAWDSCVAAVAGTVLTRQRDELPAPVLPPSPTTEDIASYYRNLRLRDPSRLGGIGWLRGDF